MIGLDLVFLLLGLIFAAAAALSLRDRSNPRRVTSAAFWGLFALSFLAGKWLGDIANGCIAVSLAAIAGLGGLGKGAGETKTPAAREASAERFGALLFLPALLIPIVALLGSLCLKYVAVGGHPLVDPKQVTFVSLALGVILALALAMPMLRARPAEPLMESHRLLETIGWAALLPQMLAALGAVFALAGVGKLVGDLASHYLPLSTPFAAVCAYTLGMAVFTIVMGNAFAAFPVMTAGIGLPLIVTRFGGDPAVVGAIGMLSGFCGTLVTPMAANFNLVPPALLDLPRYAVIRVQAPTAGIMLIVNTALMYLLAFHK
ncbi:MAG: DUF979 domain-containing protein [Pseudomonadota bacterium]|nr:DUF979 domain-containing protein [Pseudomonadota bacterium]